MWRLDYPMCYKCVVDHLYWDLGDCEGGACFEVELRGSSANVYLLDVDHYQAYLDGDEHLYYGGYYDMSPVVLQVPYGDRWYLVVGGNEQRIRVHVAEIFD